MQGYNLFVRTNLPMFDVNGYIPNYGKLTFSLGDLRLPDNLSVQDDVETPGGIAITWANNAGVGNAQANDRLRVLSMSDGEVSKPLQRSLIYCLISIVSKETTENPEIFTEITEF